MAPLARVADVPNVTAVVLVADMSAKAASVLVDASHSTVCPVGTGVAKVIVQVFTSVPVKMIVPLLSLPEMLFVLPHEESTGLLPEVTTWPVLSMSNKSGAVLVPAWMRSLVPEPSAVSVGFIFRAVYPAVKV